ncbi:hypothetical protein [Azotosporobacter soli]|uniref:hypothetical protein n=1 Tax=Azotosporobacter soli TaxID=3055040 RepID=UPI0031FEBC5B
MKKSAVALLSVLLLTLYSTPTSQAATINYYYSEHCENCKAFAPYWEKFVAEKSGEHQFEKKQTDASVENKNELLNRNMQYRGIAHTEIPAILVTDNQAGEDVLLIGLEEINLLPEILGENGRLIPGMESRELTSAIITRSGKMPTSLFYPFTLAALADASNPCALFVFIVATSYATVFCGRAKAVVYAVTFCATMFLVYLGAGLVGNRLINIIFGASPWITLMLSLGMLLLAVFHLRTALFPHQTRYSELPYRLKELIVKNASKCVSFGGAIASGVLCALVEMPCTGGPYIFALNIISKMPTASAVLCLLYYNLIFITPLLLCLIILLVAPQYVERLDVWRVAYRRWMHLLMGLLLLAAAFLGIINYA